MSVSMSKPNDSTLNTRDCEAVLSGSTRYLRGENMFRYMNLNYGSNHNHERLIAQRVSHQGWLIYKSSEFRYLLTSLIND